MSHRAGHSRPGGTHSGQSVPQSRTLADVSKLRFVVVLAVALAVVFVLGVLAVVALTRTTHQTQTFAGPISKIIVTTDRGAVTVRGGSGSVVRVVADKRLVVYGSDVTESVHGGVLSVLSNCPMMAFISCSTNFTITAPPGTDIQATAQRGLLTVTGMTGSVSSNSESGDFVLAGPTPSVTAYSLEGTIAVTLTKPPSFVHLRSETGDVTATLPPGAYAINANSGIGSASVTGLVSHRGAARSIYASSGSGRALVRAGG